MTAETRAAILEVAYEPISKVYKDIVETTPRGSRDEDMLYDFQEVMDKLFRLSKRVKGGGAE